MKVALLVFSVLFSSSVFASTFDNVYQKIKQRTEQFKKDTGKYTACFLNTDLDRCVTGLDKLIELIPSGIFSTDKFESIYVDDRMQNVSAYGYLLFSFSASTAEIKTFVESQNDFFANYSKAQKEFRKKNNKWVSCHGYEVTQIDCLEGLKKLDSISSSGVFGLDTYVSIILNSRFGSISTSGQVSLDAKASAQEMEDFLRQQ